MYRLYKLVFHSDNNHIGEMEKYTHHPSDDIANNYAAWLLQLEVNTMFHTVEVWGPFQDDTDDEWEGTPSVFELHTTREAKRREL